MRSPDSLKSIMIILVLLFFGGCESQSQSIERPEKIVSKRVVVYDDETYSKLADLWKKYYDQFPSEDAYANWMYAARYANWEDYELLLEEGVKKYPANPTLLYLKALTKHGKSNNAESISLLEKAVELDPSFIDPWFGLAVDYMSSGQPEKLKEALSNLLKYGAIAEEVMDYNYNVLTTLEKDAILITNGDNDTYPGWILTQIVNYRPDLKTVNRALLNTDWYPMYIQSDGVPEFIKKDELNNLREDILGKIKNGETQMPKFGPFADTLISRLIERSVSDGTPIYLAATLFRSDAIERYRNQGMDLGFVSLLSNTKYNKSQLLRDIIQKWISEFRTGGLNSWNLKYSDNSSAGKHLVINYGAAIYSLIDDIVRYTPENQLDLFNWYKANLEDLLPKEETDKLKNRWCGLTDIEEIKSWCKKE